MDNTIKIFKEISKLPRPSGKEEKVKNYLVNFAKKNNLEYYTDKTHNVIIKKPSNRQDCTSTLILQGHTDMVCEKFSKVEFDFDKRGIDIRENDEFLYANGTTLGADNGIGISMILSILQDESLSIPNLECVFTAQEETTMQGAIDLDFNKLKGQALLSIDGTDEGKIEVSSAGMAVAKIEKQFEEIDNPTKITYNLYLSGLQGGHSGTEINRNRLNANKLMFEFLNKYKTDINIISVSGGGKSNAIARECNVLLSLNKLNSDAFESDFKNFCKGYAHLEGEISAKIVPNTKFNYKNLCSEDTINLIDFVNDHKDGVLVFAEYDKNFPIVSNNFANIQLENGKLEIIISLRSSVKKLEEEYLSKLEELTKQHLFSFKVISTAPFFERKQNSYLQKLCCKCYKNLFDEEAILSDVHAGLEGGVFAGKNPNLDICVIAPNIYDAHSPKERVSKKSIEKTYKWLEEIIKNF